MADRPKVYWDACTWISLICVEPGRVDRCESLVALARNGDLEIWTSSLTLAEVYKVRGRLDGAQLPAEHDHAFEEFLEQDFVVEVQVDHEIGVMARDLLRAHSPPLRCNDAVHVATALVNNLDELHTFDATNLLPLNGLLRRKDGRPLVIREPPAALVIQQVDLFARAPGVVDEPAQPADPALP